MSVVTGGTLGQARRCVSTSRQADRLAHIIEHSQCLGGHMETKNYEAECACGWSTEGELTEVVPALTAHVRDIHGGELVSMTVEGEDQAAEAAAYDVASTFWQAA